jgi:hypothetical protein
VVTTPLRKIVSGGQTGVDRAALDVAIALGIAHGGWCPAGRLAEDGRIPPHYALRGTASSGYAVRTSWIVRDSDGTLVLATGPPRGGSALTCELARAHGKALLVVDLAEPPPPAAVHAWIAAHAIETLNVAGPRASTEAGVYERARAYLRTLLAPRTLPPRGTPPAPVS